MTIAAFTRRMIELGASPEVVEFALDYVTRTSADVCGRHADASADARRERDKIRQRARRKMLKLQRDEARAQANDGAADVTRSSADASADANPTATDSIHKEESIGEVKTEKQARKKEGTEDARARGTRMVAGAILTDEARAIAVSVGAVPEAVPDIWAEFVDYWVAIPGWRGCKTDWPATWRNRVRTVLKRGSQNGHQRPQQQSLGDVARKLADQARDLEREAGLFGPDVAVGRH